MKVVALISGGKDSCYNMLQCVSEGHDITALANLMPKDKDELDSYMYQTVGHHAVDLYAEAMDLPLYRHTIEGSSVQQGRDYQVTDDDEVEDLYKLLQKVQRECGIEGVSVGAILSDYQRVRVEHVCGRLGLTSLGYLWRREQTELLKEMIDCQVYAILIKVAALGLEPAKHLGKTLAEICPHMLKMKDLYGLNVCGEGGEYETFTLDCPLFNKKIVLDEIESVLHSDDAFSPVGYLNLKKAHLEKKDIDTSQSHLERLKNLPLKRSSDLLRELFTEDELDDINKSPIAVSSKTVTPSQDNVDVVLGVNICQRNSGLVGISGILGIMPEPPVPITALAQSVMEKLKATLTELSMTTKELCAVHLYVSNMADFAKVNAVYKTYFGTNPPVRVCVQLDLPKNVALKLDCCGYKEVDGSDGSTRHTMHVQGLSHWAPANIGPYSQSVKLGSSIYVAGQIAMIPSSLQLIPDIRAQSRLSLRHVSRVLAAMHAGIDISSVVMAICYVTHHEYIQHARKELQHALRECEESCSGPLVEYVVVPALPKGALVEWQVIANTDSQQWQCSSSSKSLGDKCVLKMETREKNVDGTYLHSSMVSLESSVGGLPSCKEFMTDILSCYPTNHDDTLTLRIFYRQDVFKMDDLYTGYSSAMKSLGAVQSPVPVFLPVQGFERDTQLLTICN